MPQCMLAAICKMAVSMHDRKPSEYSCHSNRAIAIFNNIFTIICEGSPGFTKYGLCPLGSKNLIVEKRLVDK